MKPKITGTCDGMELEKRFYMTGIKVESACPKCSKPHVRDMSNDYLMNPVVGAVEKLGGWCEPCGEDWTVKVIVRVSLEPVGE